MTREIKYRAWSKKHNRYLKITGIQYDGDKIAGVFVVYGIIAGIPNSIFLEAEDIVLEQSTGLKDKNGKEIYEGDIVEFGLSGRAEQGYVAYADEYASFEVYSKRDFIFGCLFGHAGKVIGNIHENPELLERGE